MRFSGETIRRLMHSLDLTEYEARAYLSLVEQGPLTVGKVSEASGIPRPKCYDVLKSLQSKGLVSHVLSKPMKYQALPLDVAFGNRLMQLRKELEKKEREARELKEEIEKSLERRIKGREFKVVFLEDPRSIISSMVTDAASAKREILTAISRSPASYGWEEYFQEYKGALDRGVSFRFLVHSTDHFLSRALKVKEVEKYLRSGQIKLKSTHVVHQPFSIIDDKVTYIYLTDPIRREFLLAIRIEDEVFAKHMRAIFEFLWKEARGC